MPPCGHGPLYVFVAEWWPGYEYHRALNAPWPLENVSNIQGTSLEYCVHVYGEADLDHLEVNAVDGPFQHNVLNMKFANLQEPCRRADAAVSSSKVNVVELVLGHVSVPIAGGVFSSEALRHTARKSEVHLEYGRLVAQMCNVTTECGRRRSFSRHRDSDTIDFGALRNTSRV